MLRPDPIGPIPTETVRIARAAFPKGNLYLQLRDELGVLYSDADFASLFPIKGQPALPAWRLALVTVFQFLENLTDRQAADQVRARLDWKYALGLELEHAGFDFSVLSEFRSRLLAGGAEQVLLDKMLERFKTRGYLRLRGRQRTDSTHILGAIRNFGRLELIGETFRAALNAVATQNPDWLRPRIHPRWASFSTTELRKDGFLKAPQLENSGQCKLAWTALNYSTRLRTRAMTACVSSLRCFTSSRSGSNNSRATPRAQRWCGYPLTHPHRPRSALLHLTIQKPTSVKSVIRPGSGTKFM